MTSSTLTLPDLLHDGDELTLRRWVTDDAIAMQTAIEESIDHLRPWMWWAGREMMTLDARREMIAGWERDWAAGGDVMLGIFVAGRVAGSCGLHRRIAADGVEIGYWVHPGFLRRGIATRTARLLAEVALQRPDITHVEIHHDAANVRSAGIPRKLGFTRVAENPRPPQAPSEVGVEWCWRLEKSPVPE